MISDPPWPIHPCFESRVGGQILDRAAYRAYMVSVYGQPFEPKSRSAPPRFAPRALNSKGFRKQAPTLVERPVDIARCDPHHFLGSKLQVVGFVHDLHQGWSISRFAKPGSIGYATFRRVIGSELFSQLTIVDSDFMSYTVIVPGSSTPVRRGAMVALLIEAAEALKDSLFICRSLNVVRWKRG
jgi:hypothetical protein